MSRNYEDAYAREREMSPSKSVRVQCRGIAHSCVLESLKMDVVKVTSTILDKHESILRGGRVGPSMLMNPLILSHFDGLRSAVKEHTINELIKGNILRRHYDASTMTSAEPIVSLMLPITRAPTTVTTFRRIATILKGLEEVVDWKRLQFLLDVRMRKSFNIKRVTFGNRPSLNVWLNPVRSLNVICRNYIDRNGEEVDAHVYDVVKNVEVPHIRMEVARALDTPHQYTAQLKVPIFVLMKDGTVACNSITILHIDMVMNDDPEFPFLTDRRCHRMYTFSHQRVRLPFFTFRCLIFRTLIPSLDPDTSSDLSIAAIFFVLSYLQEEERTVTLDAKLRHLDTFLAGGSPHVLFDKVRESVRATSETLSVQKRGEFIKGFIFAFETTLYAYMASQVLGQQRVISFITPQSIEDSHY